jgi:phosphate-selective porin OprO/OprP
VKAAAPPHTDLGTIGTDREQTARGPWGSLRYRSRPVARTPRTGRRTDIRRILALILLFLAALSAAPPVLVAASETDALIQLLVDKGLITVEEAAALRSEPAVQKQEEKDLRPKEFQLTAGKALKLSGYTQARYRQADTIKDTFDVRRARLSLRGDLGSGFDYRLQADFAGSSAKLLDAALGWRYSEGLKVTAGQFKIPFSQENLQSSNKMELINRSLVVGALVARGLDVIGEQNGRDVGIMAGGTWSPGSRPSLVEYAAGVFNGSGINRTDPNDQKDLVGRLVVKPRSGLSVGLSCYEGRYILASAPDKRDIRRRLGAEFAYQAGPFLARGEYIKGQDAEIRKDGWYLLGGWMAVPGKFQLLYRYDAYDPDRDLDGNGSRLDTIGFAWYINKWVFLQVNYDRAGGRLEKTSSDAYIGQLTLQF